jgi:hypothetical protein
MRKSPRALTDADLLKAVQAKADRGSRLVDSTLAAERREVTEYYLGKRPIPSREGGSKFVSQDVYLSVETMKASIVETFGAGNRIVEFAPQGADDVQLARQATACAEVAIHRQNSGLEVFQDVVHDALTNRVGIAKVFWDKRETAEDYRFTDVTQAEAVAFLSRGNVRLKSKPTARTAEDGTILLSGEFEEITDCSQVVIEPVPPEEFIITGRTRSLHKAPYLAHRYRTTLGELVDAGYDEKLVYEIGDGDDDLAYESEQLQREQDTSSGLFDDDDAVDEAGRIVTVYESYIRIDAEGTGRQQLWKVVHCGHTLLDKQKVSDHPFLAYIPQPIPHTFFGNNFAARTISHANTKTVLTRAIIEQAVEATQPRWQVARGGVANPRELIDNRRGGIVNVRSITDSVAPLPQTPINPFVLQTIAAIDSDREDTTGISRLSQGLDKKALSHQNSQGLVEQLTSNSQTRTKVIARNFALQFVSQLYLKAYQLIIENETRERIIEIAGSFVPISPARWRARRDVSVDMTLGYGERDQRVAEMADLHMTLKDDPKLSRSYGEQQAYNLWRDTLTIKGLKNIGDYLVDPASLGPPEPDPMKAAELQKLQTDIDVAQRQMALRETQVSDELARNRAEMQWKQITGQHEMSLKDRDADRKDAETANRIDIGLAELELAINAQITAPPENQKMTAIASPNS